MFRQGILIVSAVCCCVQTFECKGLMVRLYTDMIEVLPRSSINTNKINNMPTRYSANLKQNPRSWSIEHFLTEVTQHINIA